MNTESPPSRAVIDARLLQRTAGLLFGLSLLNGFAIHAARLPRLALSAHLVGLIAAAFLIALAGVWPRLTLRPTVSRVAAGTVVYGFVAGWLLYLLAALTGIAGLFPLAGGGVRGGELAETVMSAAFSSVALALFALSGILFRSGALRPGTDDVDESSQGSAR